jgi:pyruvate dehydrogenase E2 component (dihydrolipoamide acetyltransferase)
MAYSFKFPDIGEGIHEGKILEWYVKPGDKVREGDPLMKVETDKVVTDIPIPRHGLIKQLFGEVGQVIHVGNVIAEIETEGAAVTVEAPGHATKKAATAETHEEKVDEPGFGVVGSIPVASTNDFLPATGEGLELEHEKAAPTNGRKALATPVARKMARDMNVDINTIAGTGPGGRVMKEDILHAAERTKSTPTFSYTPPRPAPMAPPGERTEIEELSQIRKSIAARMAQSKYTAPHSTSHDEIEISKLVALRNEIKDHAASLGLKVSYLPFIIRALALTLPKHKKLNCRLDLEHNRVIYNRYYNIGIAVDTPDGLVVPVIKDADRKSIYEIAGAITDLSNRARDRKLTLDEIREGTFTLTNYGSIAGIHGVPVINYPEVAILGVGRIREVPVVKNGQIVPGTVLPLSMSFDHRIVDGGDAARFLLDLMALLSEPASMLMM